MRLSLYEIKSINRKILEDMYAISTQDFIQRKSKIAEQNREYYLKPLEDKINKLPDELIAKSKEYPVRIRYKKNANDTEFAINDIWIYTSSVAIINPQNSPGKYISLNVPVNVLDPRLYKITAILCNEILALSAEKNKLIKFLKETTNKYSGTIQLKKVWPESLHKYLPAEPPKKPRKTRKLAKEANALPAIEVPSFISTRMTTNLLEGN